MWQLDFCPSFTHAFEFWTAYHRKMGQNSMKKYSTTTTSAFLENMLIFMCWHEKKPPSNMKHFNVVKLFGFVPRKYSGVCTQSSPVHFHSETMGLILEWLLDCCALQTFAVLSAGDREGVISCELFLWESPHAAPAISDALQFIQCQNWHWGAAAAASRAGIQETGALPTVGTAEATSLLNKCIHKAQSCKTVIKYCTFCL